MFGLGPIELIIIIVIILLIFGAKRFPDIGKGLGGAIREFKNIKKEISPKETEKKGQDSDNSRKNKDAPPALEAKVVEKVLEQVPGVRKVMAVKKKAESIKKIIK
ncbi:MAG TPA: twin-arginine translocase TatA/TatE family subunit [Desulfobacteraceae bacterium]|nr:twin-arginine translocase TatA/TatE family subunit [Desulfobacteraceae bacterium]